MRERDKTKLAAEKLLSELNDEEEKTKAKKASKKKQKAVEIEQEPDLKDGKVEEEKKEGPS